MWSDTAAYTQTTCGYCDILHIAEYLGTNGSLEEVPGTTVCLVEEGDHKKLAQKLTTGTNMYIFYMQIS